MSDVVIILRNDGHRFWSAALRDEENEMDAIISYAPNAQAALDNLLSEAIRRISTQEKRKRNRKPAQVDGYIGIPKRQIS